MERTQFASSIEIIARNWQQLRQEGKLCNTIWHEVRLMKSHCGGQFLRITRDITPPEGRMSAALHDRDTLVTRPEEDDGGDDDDDDDDDDDNESLAKFNSTSTRKSPSITPIPIVYDIIYSPTYQVPVLYIHRTAQTLLKDLYAPSAQAVGVMGGLTLVDHPETGQPVFFVHPCRTQEAVRNVLGSAETADGREWLMVWFGVIGSAVGLSLPVDLAGVMSREKVI